MATSDALPVILVPGFSGQNIVYWNILRRMLEGDGHPTFTISFPRIGLGDIRVSAARLALRVEEVKAVTGASKVDLVGHSIGGLVSRQYTERLGGHDHVHTVVTLATPHHGTVAGWLAYPMAGGRQIIPDSSFLRQLNGNGGMRLARRAGVRYHNIYSLTDPLLVPKTSAHLDGAENKKILFGGHLGMLVSPRVFRLVKEALTEPG